MLSDSLARGIAQTKNPRAFWEKISSGNISQHLFAAGNRSSKKSRPVLEKNRSAKRFKTVLRKKSARPKNPGPFCGREVHRQKIQDRFGTGNRPAKLPETVLGKEIARPKFPGPFLGKNASGKDVCPFAAARTERVTDALPILFPASEPIAEVFPFPNPEQLTHDSILGFSAPDEVPLFCFSDLAASGRQ